MSQLPPSRLVGVRNGKLGGMRGVVEKGGWCNRVFQYRCEGGEETGKEGQNSDVMKRDDRFANSSMVIEIYK